MRQGVNEVHCEAIAKALVLMPSIETIDLAGNAIGRVGAESLGCALASVDQPDSHAATPGAPLPGGAPALHAQPHTQAHARHRVTGGRFARAAPLLHPCCSDGFADRRWWIGTERESRSGAEQCAEYAADDAPGLDRSS
jgi:hypothetical protein